MAKSKRRGQGEGNVYQRADGRWCSRLSHGWLNGKRVRKWFYGATAANVQDQLTVAKGKKLAGVPIDGGRPTVARHLDDWLAAIKSSVRDRTFERYQDIAKKHLKPELGRIRLEKLKPRDVQALLDEKLKGGLHPRTVQGIRQVLSYALNEAMRWELLSRNVAALVRGPKAPQHEMTVWNEEQARHFLDCCDREPLGALYVLALHTGLRRGELSALRWSDADIDAGLVTVRRSLQRSRTRGLIFEEPKTEKARRSIRLAPAVVAALKAHRKRQAETRLGAGPLWQDGDLVFCTGIGTPLDPRTLGIDYDRMIEKSKLPRIRLHDLRHTFATIGLSKNIHPKVMSEMLGHSKIALTLDVYSHALPSLQADAADKIAEALTGTK
jgi:integrase